MKSYFMYHYNNWQLYRLNKGRNIYNQSECSYLMLIHWWIRQKVSNMKRRAFSMKSSRQATKKKSFTSTYMHKIDYKINVADDCF